MRSAISPRLAIKIRLYMTAKLSGAKRGKGVSETGGFERRV